MLFGGLGAEKHRRAKHAKAEQLRKGSKTDDDHRYRLDDSSRGQPSTSLDHGHISASNIRHRSHSAEVLLAPSNFAELRHSKKQRKQPTFSSSNYGILLIILGICILGVITSAMKLGILDRTTNTGLISDSDRKLHSDLATSPLTNSETCLNDIPLVVTSSLIHSNPCYLPALQGSAQGCSCSNAKGYAVFELASGESSEDSGNEVDATKTEKEELLATQRERNAYRIPKLDGKTLSPTELRDKVVFVFIHINKAAGTTIKQSVLFRSAIVNQWDGAGFGTPKGWAGLGDTWEALTPAGALTTKPVKITKPANSTLPIDNLSPNGNPRTWLGPDPLYLRCGRPIGTKNLLFPFQKMNRCPLRFVWGSNSLGLCEHFGNQPCVYFTVLRHPVSRMISQYNYVCLRGKESRKKWLPEWKKAGKCPWDIFEFIERNMTSTTFLQERLSQGCGGACDRQAAIQNLRSPCMRYLLLENLPHGFGMLAEQFGESLRPHFQHAAQGGNVYSRDYPLTSYFSKRVQSSLGPATFPPKQQDDIATGESSVHNNVAEYDTQSLEYLLTPEVMNRLEKILAQDMELYEIAVKEYHEQWTRPLQSCNPS